MTVVRVTLSEVAAINPRESACDALVPEDIVTFVPMSAVSDITASIGAPEERNYGDVSTGYTRFQQGDVIIAKITPCFENGKIALAANLPTEAATGSTEFHVVRAGEAADAGYLFHLLRSPQVRIAGSTKMRGAAGQRRVPTSFLGDLQIPLPPVPEQKRIAAILDAADTMRSRRRESLELLDRLVQSLFLEMFGDPVTNPMRWDVVTLPALATHFTDGPFGSNLKSSHYRDSGVRVIRLQNIGVGKILNDDVVFISDEHYASLPRNHCRPGDVLIATLGDPNLRAAVLPSTIDRALNKADCLLLRVEPARALPVYVCTLLNSRPILQAAGALVRGQTRGRISKGRLSDLPVPLPPLDLQGKFARAMTRLERHVSLARDHLAELDTLFASLQARAFRGEL